MKDYTIKFEYEGKVRTYSTVAQHTEELALASWRFYCIKKKLFGARFLAITPKDPISKKVNVGLRNELASTIKPF